MSIRVDWNLTMETVMAARTLKDMKYLDGVPASGLCSQCGREFVTPDVDDAEQATRDFYARFKSHDCQDTPLECHPASPKPSESFQTAASRLAQKLS
jgi:hypothetical protein